MPRSPRHLSALLHFVFFLSGIATVLIGQILPILAAKYSLNDLQSGYLFPAQFAGSITGTFFTNWFARRGRLVTATALGSVLMVTGLLMLNLASYELVLAAFLINGLGIGLTLPAINVLVLERDPANSASRLAILNFFWGLGAIVCKPFVDLTTGGGNSIALTTALIAVPLALTIVPTVLARNGAEATVTRPETGEPSLTPIWSNPIAWAIALFNFIHVGFESGIGGWLTTYSTRLEIGPIGLASPTFLYFLFFVVGRGIAPIMFRFLSENRALMAGLVTIFAGLIVVLWAEGLLMLSIGASMCGLGTSSIFPTNVSRFSKYFGAEAMRRATPLFISATLGGAVITWLIGFLSERAGDLRSGMYVLLVSVGVLIVLQIGLSLRTAAKQSV